VNTLDYWKLCDDFSVVQAALLILGEDPTELQYDVERAEQQDKPENFEPVFAALKGAVEEKRLPAKVKGVMEADFLADNWERETAKIDWCRTMIRREDLVEWLLSHNFKPGFFFEQPANAPDYLDPKHPNYSPKLAAAVRAWEAVTTDNRYFKKGKSPKNNIESWLTAHAAEYCLLKKNGKINTEAIENQIAKVVNWKPDGGAPKTPSRK
jgi:hypothetical protein